VAKTGCFVYPRGAGACRDKWQTLFGEYKKIFDYKGRTGNNEDYFRMASKRRKDLGLPVNFCSSQYRDMERFLSQRPCLNPPHQRDTLDDNDQVYITPDQLHSYCAANNINPADLAHDNFIADSVMQETTPYEDPAWSAEPVLPPKPPVAKGRPSNTAVRRRHSSSQTKMVEVTESQGKELVLSMKKIGEVEDTKVAAVGEMAASQLAYFKVRDEQISANQRGLIDAVHNLSNVMGRAFASRVIPVPPPAGTERPLSAPCSPRSGPTPVAADDEMPPWAASRCKPVHDGSDYNPPAGNSVAREGGSSRPQQHDLEEAEENIAAEERDDAREAADNDGYIVVDGEDLY
jgi:hypothetical protein